MHVERDPVPLPFALSPPPQVQGAERKMLANQRRIQGRTAAGQWGTVGGEESAAAVSVPPEELAAITRRLDELDKNHQRAIGRFTEQLPAQVRGSAHMCSRVNGGRGSTRRVKRTGQEPPMGHWVHRRAAASAGRLWVGGHEYAHLHVLALGVWSGQNGLGEI
jgi:hypothetical protein